LADRLLSRVRRLSRSGRAVEALPMLDRLARVPGRLAEAAAAQAEAFLALGRPEEAEAVADCVAAAGVPDPALLALRAEARLARGNHRGAMADAAELVMADPACPRAKALLGRALLEAGRFDEAVLLLLGQALAVSPEDRSARTALAEALVATGRPAAAAELAAAPRDIAAPAPPAIAAAPRPQDARPEDEDPEPTGAPAARALVGGAAEPAARNAPDPLRQGIAALRAGEPNRAVPLLERAVAESRDPYAVLNLGLALGQVCRASEAVPLLQEAAAVLPGHPEPRFHLGRLRGLRGDRNGAALDFQAALALCPGHVPSLAALAALKEDAGEWDAAAELVAAARAAEPAEPELAFAAGRLASRRGNAAAALAAAAEVLERRPAHAGAARLYAEAALALEGPDAASARVADRAAAEPFAACWPIAAAILHGARGEPVAALGELRLAEALAPAEGEVVAALGRALAGTDACGEAEAVLRAAIALCPADVDLRNLLATVLWKAHKLTPMLEVLDAASREFGPHPALLLNRALALNACGDQEAALAASDAAVRAGGGLPALVTRLVVLPYHPREGTAAKLLRAAGSVAAALAPVPHRACRRPADPDRPLRIGLLSGGLGQHPVGWLTVAGIEALPWAEFECVAYALKRRADGIADRFRARCALWRDVERSNDDAIARLIADDGVDIVLDLGGYGEGGRPFALAGRPAPVQIKWVGAQFGTTGLPAMDGMITDRWETPPGHERFFSERLLRLRDGYVCYSPPPYAPAVSPPPALRDGRVTFGCFNNLAKVTPAVLLAWGRVLAQVPDSKLVLRTHALDDAGVREALSRRMARLGLPAGRIELAGSLPHRELLEAYNGVDIALDPFPYTGGLTVCEALWMGVPVVSLAGDSFCGRHALSHLSNVGLAGWVAETEDGYVREAVRRAADPRALAELRAGLRARVEASPLCDAPRFGASLAEALRGAWRAWCAGEGAAAEPAVSRTRLPAPA
jgi:tetratricopeptide (TPR) repeat protein/glycosyltransferase involved in cell wall biosynthesis